MNILCINHEYPPVGGGGATACKNICTHYAKMGHTVTVITVWFPGVAPNEEIDNLGVFRLKCKRSSKDSSSFGEMLSFLFAAFRFINLLVKKEKLDFVHIFFGVPSGPLGLYLKKRYKIPYVVRLGGGDIPGTQNRFGLIYTMLTPILKMVWREAQCVVANSEGLLQRAQRFYSRANFSVIPNGVNIEEYPQAKVFFTDSTLNIVTVTRIVERKGVQHVINALTELAAETAGNIRYTIVGDGPYRPEVELLAERLDVAKYIKITGFVPFDEVIGYLQKADVFVLASDWEGMPNVVLEAMAMHLPVVMTDCEGSRELVTDNGFVIRRGIDVSANIAEKILLLYSDRDLVAKMGKAGYRRAREKFAWSKTAEDYLDCCWGSSE